RLSPVVRRPSTLGAAAVDVGGAHRAGRLCGSALRARRPGRALVSSGWMPRSPKPRGLAVRTPADAVRARLMPQALLAHGTHRVAAGRSRSLPIGMGSPHELHTP